MLLKDELDGLAGFLKGEERILAAYLFGSYASGVETRESGVDVALLLSEAPKRMREYYLLLENKLLEILKRDVGLVFLSDLWIPPNKANEL